MPNTAEQQRIVDLEYALQIAMRHIVRLVLNADYSHKSAVTFLHNHGLNPTSREAKALLKHYPEAYHHELEKAVKRAVGK